MLGPEPEVVGRDHELGRIEAVLDSIGTAPNVVLVDGPAGAGKTTLLHAAVGMARLRGFRVLTCSAVEPEARLSFVGLRDLLDGVFDETAALLPSPQRRALAVALLREEPGVQPVQSGAVAVAVLTVVRQLSAQQPVLVAVDDFPWLDRSTTSVLCYALRRLNGKPICAVFTRRLETPEQSAVGADLQGMDLLCLPLGPLSLGAVQALVRDRYGLVLPRPNMRRLYESSGGNPFYALGIAQQAAEGHQSIGSGEPLAVPDDVHLLVIERIGRLSSHAQAVLPAIASLPRPMWTAVVASLDGEPAVDEGIREAIDAGVLRSDGDRIEFAHPLFAAAVYSRLPQPDRRRLHRRLAEVTFDVEERAHHLARAADGPSEESAAALDLAAEAARARGAPAAAAEFAEEATRATPPDDATALQARLVTAAEHHFEAGDTKLAVRRLEQAMAEEASRRTWAGAAVHLGRILLFRDDLSESAKLFRAVRDERQADSAVRLEAEEGLAWSLLLARENLTEATQQARRAVRAGRRWQNDAVLAEALAVSGLAEMLLGRPRGGEHIDDAVDLAAQRRYSRVMRHPRWASAVRRVWTDDLAAARTELLALRQDIEDVGDESSLPRVLLALSHVHLLQGDWERAASCAREGGEAAAASGQEPQAGMLLWTAGMVDAHLGQLDDTRRTAQQRLSGGVVAAMSNRWTLGFCALSSGDHEQAYDHLNVLAARHDDAGVREPGALRFVPDLIEASIHLGRLVEAKWRLERYLALADELGRVSAQLMGARCRGLLLAAEGKLEAAIATLEAAASDPQASLFPFDQARTRLALGTALRRAKRRGEARQAIAASTAAFDRLGASAWSERATTELGRIGGRALTPWELTPAEARIASLVATGRSNREVAAELFVTVKTVETTLTRIYRKLGLRSRAELVRALAIREPSERKV